MANEWEGALFWPIAFSHQPYVVITLKKIILFKGGWPKVRLSSGRRTLLFYPFIKELKKSPLLSCSGSKQSKTYKAIFSLVVFNKFFLIPHTISVICRNMSFDLQGFVHKMDAFFFVHIIRSKIVSIIRAQIWKLLRSPVINSKESIPPGYIGCRTGTTTRFRLGSHCRRQLNYTRQ
jgi:hypothetical protein